MKDRNLKMKRLKLLNLIKNNFNAPGKRFDVKNEGENEATIYLYDVIDNWWGIDSESFVKELNNLKVDTIHLRINSPGGDVFDARAIQTALKAHKAKVIVHIDGLAASAATYVVLAGDEINMSEGAFFMIHKGWTISLGNADEMRSTANLLDKIDDSITNDYHRKTGIAKDELITMMSEETWFSASEALEKGFIDSIPDSDDESVENQFNLDVYDNVPNTINNEIEEPKPVFNQRTPFYQRLSEIYQRPT